MPWQDTKVGVFLTNRNIVLFSTILEYGKMYNDNKICTF